MNITHVMDTENLTFTTRLPLKNMNRKHAIQRRGFKSATSLRRRGERMILCGEFK
jgi:hypothetical protein